MCIQAQLPDEATGYSGGKVIFVDTEGTFRTERLIPICERFNVDHMEALEVMKIPLVAHLVRLHDVKMG